MTRARSSPTPLRRSRPRPCKATTRPSWIWPRASSGTYPGKPPAAIWTCASRPSPTWCGRSANRWKRSTARYRIWKSRVPALTPGLSEQVRALLETQAQLRSETSRLATALRVAQRARPMGRNPAQTRGRDGGHAGALRLPTPSPSPPPTMGGCGPTCWSACPAARTS